MSKVCSICDKSRMSGNNVSHSVRRTRRSWAPNVQKVKVVGENGATTSAYVCTSCLKSGKITRG